MKLRIIPTLTFTALLLAGKSASAGTFTSQLFAGDADSGISSALQYTAAIDFNGTGTRTINGVTFSSTALAGTYHTLSEAGEPFAGFGNSVGGTANGLVSDFFYTSSGSGNATLTLSGLTVGTEYVTSWYSAGFGPVGGRMVNITPSDTNIPFLFDQNFSGNGNGNILRYTYIATAPFITFGFDALSNGDSFHHYALTNSGSLPTPGFTPVTPVFTSAVSPVGGSYSPFTVSNTDLLQTSLASVSTSGAFGDGREGTGGVGVLTNGTFSITGIGNNNPQLAVGPNNSSVTFTLDTTVNIFGYDITSIAGYGGWNDGGRDRQKYNIFFSRVGDPTFSLFGSVDQDVAGPNGNPSAGSAIFTPASALGNVDAIRIDFPGGQENGHAGYGEFDVIGAASVPEPASAMLMLAGLAVCNLRRRR